MDTQMDKLIHTLDESEDYLESLYLAYMEADVDYRLTHDQAARSKMQESLEQAEELETLISEIIIRTKIIYTRQKEQEENVRSSNAPSNSNVA